MPIPSYFNINGTKIVDKTKIVNSFNTYVVNIGSTTHIWLSLEQIFYLTKFYIWVDTPLRYFGIEI